MQYFNFWARAQGDGPDFPVTCWGYSNESLAAATEMAEKRVLAAVKKLSDAGIERSNYYDVDPLKERVIEKIISPGNGSSAGSDNDSGSVIAVVTRNAYGALVLNTTNVAFLDVDIARAKSRGPLVSLWKKLTGDGNEDKDEKDSDGQLAHIRSVLSTAPDLSGNVYRTANGYRILITSAIFTPDDKKLQSLMHQLGVDELYQKLCLRQKCFRARLTPKPWRIGMPRPPVRYPLIGDYSRSYQSWLEKYETRSRKFRVCQYIESFGDLPVSPDVELILKLHDGDLAEESHKLA